MTSRSAKSIGVGDLSGDIPLPEGSTVDLCTPLDSIDDLWPVLRRAAEILPGSGVLRTRWTTGRLDDRDVASILRLAGLEPIYFSRDGEERIVDVRKAWRPSADGYSCSVIVPCRNEVENVEPLTWRLPALGRHTELIFVDGQSTDGTAQAIERIIERYPERDIKLLHQQEASGKAAATFQGFDAASGDILMILDADMTVAPEDLTRFYLALAEDVAEFANGTRFLHPMETGAMRPTNWIGNRAFSVLYSWLLGRRITDTLCGTKALFRRDWARIRAVRPLFGGHDPWGDFDLLLGAAFCGARFVDVPIRYRARIAGESKMHAFRHGAVLARTCLAGTRQLKMRRRTRSV